MDGTVPSGPTTTRDAVVDLAAATARLALAMQELELSLNCTHQSIAQLLSGNHEGSFEALKLARQHSGESGSTARAGLEEIVGILRQLGQPHG